MKLGFNKYISNMDYHKDREYISSTGLKLMYNDPREYYKAYIENKSIMKGDQSKLDFGSYIHSLILEPHLTDEEFAIYEGAQRRGSAWEVFKEENKEKIIITKSQANAALPLIEKFNSSKIWIGKEENEKEVLLNSFFKGGMAEETLCVEIEGIKCKVRFDYRKEFEDFGSINDIKTTSYMVDTIDKAEGVCASFDYDISAALYVDAVEQIQGKPYDFYFFFLCKVDNLTYVYKASEQMLEEGRRKYKIALNRLKKARETGIFYKNIIKEIDSIKIRTR